MSFKRVLMLTTLAVSAAIALPSAAHVQFRVGIGFGVGPRPYYYRGPRVGVYVGLPPVAIGIGGPVYVQPAPVVYPVPVYVPPPVVYAAPPAPAYVAQPQMVAQPQYVNGYPVLPPQPVPIR